MEEGFQSFKYRDTSSCPLLHPVTCDGRTLELIYFLVLRTGINKNLVEMKM